MKLNIQWKRVLYGITLIVIGIILAALHFIVPRDGIRDFIFRHYCSYIGIGNISRNLYNVKWN